MIRKLNILLLDVRVEEYYPNYYSIGSICDDIKDKYKIDGKFDLEFKGLVLDRNLSLLDYFIFNYEVLIGKYETKNFILLNENKLIHNSFSDEKFIEKGLKISDDDMKNLYEIIYICEKLVVTNTFNYEFDTLYGRNIELMSFVNKISGSELNSLVCICEYFDLKVNLKLLGNIINYLYSFGRIDFIIKDDIQIINSIVKPQLITTPEIYPLSFPINMYMSTLLALNPINNINFTLSPNILSD